ncbi:hypothetical protein DFH08DRAFT_117494 [Mycena albidolilacea]|uniref:Uncharacterized protein n=1 Tax=Mycena albidolilacea TaxID=1033008 RepID=A0AAD7A6W6_9AGAR|nr:hypothetical protein DFH08DRAFT_117494 [Mycena albidolilacea]
MQNLEEHCIIDATSMGTLVLAAYPEDSRRGWGTWFGKGDSGLVSARRNLSALSICDPSGRRDQFWAEAIRAVLLRFAPRFQSISLSLPRLDFQRLVNIGAFPILETFAVTFPSDGDEEERLEILGTAPRLRNLCSEDARPSAFLIPYEGLSTVTCESLSPDDLFDLLLCAPSLEDFTGRVWDDEIARPGTITHGRLRAPMAAIYISSDFFTYPPSKIFILQRSSALKSVPFFFRSLLAHPPCDASPRVSTPFHWPPTGSPLPCRTSRTSSCLIRHRSSYSILFKSLIALRINCSSHLYKTLLCGIVLWM